MIMDTRTPAKYIAIVAPLLEECKPIWSAIIPRISAPIDDVAK
jgi:hypothetical protein